VPIDAVTNGVHLPTWVGHDMAHVFDSFASESWRDDPTDRGMWARVHEVPEWEIWHSHERQKARLIARVREQSRATSASRGLSLDGSAATDAPLEPGVLTVGFARRFAGYKRATLLFRDLDRLERILNHAGRPVQFIFAGKAHPRDEGAKQLIREVMQVSRMPAFRGKLVVLERYDVDLARALVQGCDIWLNTPLRPLEASGTSGMKAVANGALHMSVLDGWWAEAFVPGLGWTIGRDRTDDDPEVQDAFDADSVYDLLEGEASELYYDRGEGGLPWEWVRRMRGSIAAYAPEFNTNRMVRDYAEKAYGPAAKHWARLIERDLAPSRVLAAWLANVRANWEGVQVVAVEDDTASGMVATRPVHERARVRLGGLSPGDCAVELAFGPARPTGEVALPNVLKMQLNGQESDGTCLYSGAIDPDFGGRAGYQVRVLPSHPDLHNPLDTGLVRWA
jgi:starch phosphorylase